MSVESICKQIGKTIADYNAKVAQINANGNLSESYKKQLMNEAYQDAAPTAERQLKALWGDVVPTADGRNILSESGAVWSAMIAAENAQAEGKNQFLGKRYSHPELIPILEARIKSTVKRSMSGHDFLRAYEGFSQDEKNLSQDLGDAIFAGKDGRDWSIARSHIAVDLKAAESAVFDPLQEAVNQTVRDAWELALPAYRAAANLFGRDNYAIGEIAKGIHYQRVGMGYEVSRKVWGIHHANQGKVSRYEPSSPWPATKAKRG